MAARYVPKAAKIIKRGPAWASSYQKGPKTIQVSAEVRRRRAAQVEESLADNSYILGSIVKMTRLGLAENPVAKVRVYHNLLDEALSMYWPEEKDFWASLPAPNDGTKAFGLGDYVLISPMKDPMNAHVKHKVDRLVYEHGRVVNPLSRRQVWGDQHADIQDYKTKLVSKLLETAENEIMDREAVDDDSIMSLLRKTVAEFPLPVMDSGRGDPA